MELIEKISPLRTQYLSSLSFKDFQTFLTGKKSLDEQKKLYDKLKGFCETNIKTRGETKRIYSYSFCKDKPSIGGRLFCGNSAQGLPKAFRGFLFGNSTTDIDMKNAHPTLLEYLCRKNNIDCPYLSDYNARRDEILDRYSDRDCAKEMFLKAVNDDKINRKEKDAFFKAFDKEMKDIQKQLLDHPYYTYVKESVPSHKLYNFYGSAINRLLCITENNVLQSVISVINQRGIEIALLMFDGLMVYGNFYDNVELLNEIECKVAEDFPGLQLKFAYKDHCLDIEMPEDFDLENRKPDIPEDFINMVLEGGDYAIATYIAKHFGTRIKTLENKKCYYFNDKKFWDCYTMSTPIREIISNDMLDHTKKMRAILGTPKTDFENKLYKELNSFSLKLGKTNDKNNITREMFDILLDRDFENDFNKQIYVLPIKNGQLFDLRDNSVCERTIEHKFNYECNADYVEMTQEQEQDICDYFLSLFCGNDKIMQCLLNALKSSLIGKPMRYLFFLTGTGRNGKSLLFKILKHMFSNAMDILDKKVLLDLKIKSSLSTEFEKLDKCRIGYVTELDEKDELNSVIIKQITGGDSLDFRGLWKGNTTIQPTATPWILTNEMVKYKAHQAMNDRMVVFPFNNTFPVDTAFETTMLAKSDIIFSFIMKYGKLVDELELTEEMIQVKEEFKEDNTVVDYLQDFVNMNYEKVSFVKKERILRDDLRASYNHYLKSLGLQFDLSSHAKFARRMKTLGFGWQESNSKVYYTGLVPRVQTLDEDE